MTRVVVRRLMAFVFPAASVWIVDMGRLRRPTMMALVVAFATMVRRRRSRFASMGYLDLWRGRRRLWCRTRRWPRSRRWSRPRGRAWRWPWGWCSPRRRGWSRSRTTTGTRRRWPTRSGCRMWPSRRSWPRMGMMMPRRPPQIRRTEPARTNPNYPSNIT